MQTMRVFKRNPRARMPSGNPFSVMSIADTVFVPMSWFVLETGIGMELPATMDLVVRSLHPRLIPVGHHWRNGELVLAFMVPATLSSDEAVLIEEGREVALVTIVERKVVPLRFVEFSPSGGRLVKGEPREIEHRGGAVVAES